MRVAIIGSVGVPARYGGFETLVDNLARYHEAQGVACEGCPPPDKPRTARKSCSESGAAGDSVIETRSGDHLPMRSVRRG